MSLLFDGISKIVGTSPLPEKSGDGVPRVSAPVIAFAGRFDSDVGRSHEVDAAVKARSKVNKSVHCAGVLGSGPGPPCLELP